MKSENKLKFDDFYEAYNFLKEHPMVHYNKINYFSRCLDIDVVKINPQTNSIDDDSSKNTKTEVWLEFGKYDLFEVYEGKSMESAQHDYDLDCGADTFEKAIIELANLVFEKYGHEKLIDL
jgi:hypothetical protein